MDCRISPSVHFSMLKLHSPTPFASRNNVCIIEFRAEKTDVRIYTLYWIRPRIFDASTPEIELLWTVEYRPLFNFPCSNRNLRHASQVGISCISWNFDLEKIPVPSQIGCERDKKYSILKLFTFNCYRPLKMTFCSIFLHNFHTGVRFL